jgi:Lrp/AsnC family transcriptional regulator
MQKEHLSSDKSPATFTLDAVEIRILNLLQENGRLSIRELARKIGSFIAFFVNIILKEHSTRLGGEFIRQITAFPEVVEFHVIGGEHDFMIKVIVPDMAAYRRFFVEQLGEIPNIARLQSIIVLDTVKKDNHIPL